MYDIKTTVKVPRGLLKPEMLVRFTDAHLAATEGSTKEDIGVVVRITRRWVHVLWLVNTNPGVSFDSTGRVIDKRQKNDFDKGTIGKHHFITEECHKYLEPAPAGTEVTIKQIVK